MKWFSIEKYFKILYNSKCKGEVIKMIKRLIKVLYAIGYANVKML